MPPFRRPRRAGPLVVVLIVLALVVVAPGGAAPPAAAGAPESAGTWIAAAPAPIVPVAVPPPSGPAAERARAAGSVWLTGAAARVGPRVAKVDPALTDQPSGPSTEVTVHGATAATIAAVRRAGGTVVAAAGDQVAAVIPSGRLAGLAAAPGVNRVSRPVPAIPLGVVSEGVHTTGADVWHTAAITGAGVKVGIVDAGFAGLTDQVTAGNLPAGLTVAGDHCANVDNTDHGTAVAEIVHQMAPDAQLYLYCVDEAVGFHTAGAELTAAGVTVVNSSLGFPGDSRGDGTGSALSTAATVKAARLAGVLWIQSAGNSAEDHWGGTLIRDPDNPGLARLSTVDPVPDVDQVQVARNGSGLAVLQWDGWPTSNLALTLRYQQVDLTTNQPVGSPTVVTHQPGTAPVLYADLAGSGSLTAYDIAIGVPGGTLPRIRFDLTYWGSVGPSYYAGTYPGQGSAQSITEPASSPYVLGVGASAVGTTCEPDPDSSIGLERYSSRGPTIDGRVKPDLLGPDGTASAVFGAFCGTSAAAPHVAGAAALVKSANPAMDASQLQALLQDRAGTVTPTNLLGHGELNLEAPAAIEPRAGLGYTPLTTPVRVLDTRTTLGGHPSSLGAGQVVQVATGAPAGASAVAINLTGTGATTGTVLSAYPGPGIPPTSNLNLSPIDPTAAVFAVVTLAPNRTITIRNSAGSTHVVVDVLGYFGPAGADRFTALAPHRLLDTRTDLGAQMVRPGTGVTLPVGTDIDAVMVTVTATGGPATGGVFSLSPDGSTHSSTLNFTNRDRANLAIVRVAGDGTITLRDQSGSAHAVIDLVGTFSSSGSSAFVPLPAPVRVVDTRSGNGGRNSPFAAHTAQAYIGAGVGEVPARATAILANITAVGLTGASYLVAYAHGATRPPTSMLNVSAGRVVPDAAVIRLSAKSFDLYNDAGTDAVVVDTFGYFS